MSSRAVCLFLAVALLCTSAPAAPMVLADAASGWRGELGFWFREAAGGWAKTAANLLSAQGNDQGRRPQEKQGERDARVRRVKVYPGDVTLHLYERVVFSAAALDGDGQPVGGVAVTWSARDEGRGSQATRISPRGEFEARAPGTFKVTADVGGKKDHVTVTVLDGEHRRRGEQPSLGAPISSRDHGPRGSGATKSPRRRNRRGGAPTFVKASLVKPPPAPPAAARLPDCGDEYRWNRCNFPDGDDPDNRRGNPPGAPLDQGAGNGDFQIAAPLLTLPGRGLNLSLGLVYNSRVWSKNGTNINYDIDQDWPAAGWSLGFGKVVGLGLDKGGMIVDPDGTRHGFSGPPPQIYSFGSFATLHTMDGTFVDYSTQADAAGTITYAQASYPNGTLIQYGAPGAGAVYPTLIRDANGNYITVTYVNNAGPQIQTITDTLGRTVNFYYDANNLLTAITGPGLGGGTRTLVRLHYTQLPTLNTSFVGLTPVVRNYNPWALDAIYNPATGTGYWFGDADSYSSYGMIQKVVEQRGMGFSAASLNDQGTATPGVMSRQQFYDFQLTDLTDAPTFTSLTESYDGMDAAAAVTAFQSHPNASPRDVTITLPDGTQSFQLSNNHPGSFDDGLVYHDETKDANGNILRSSDVVWQQGAYESPRPISTATGDERGQKTGTEFSYGPSYNQVVEGRTYDYGYTYGGTANVLLRRRVTQYHAAAGYVSNHIFKLPTVAETYDGAGARLSRVEYQYDGATTPATPNGTSSLVGLPTTVVQHDDAWNPFAPQYWVDGYWDEECDEFGNHCRPVWVPGYWESAYVPATDYRGNVTQVIEYANAGADPAAGAVTDSRSYDITGNMVAASTSCCQQMSFEYTQATQYAYPLSQTRGSASDALAQVKTSATYDFGTGLTLTSTDANGRISWAAYYADTLRPQTVVMPTNGHTDYLYDDAAMTVTETTYLAPSPADTGAAAGQNVKYLNGAGLVKQEKALGAGGAWDFVDTQYDQMGRVSRQSRPYRGGDTPRWTTNSYDALGRVWQMEAPDGSLTRSFFNDLNPAHPRPDAASAAPGETALIVDAWGRERWGRYDALDRLVEVVEPEPGGGGSTATGGWVTNYSYDALGRLTGTNQGGQVRSFAYDSLGRLIRQKSAEADATLDNSGNYVGKGNADALWSDAFTYDDHSNLTRKADARGVVTNFDYSDPLNRLLSVSYDLSGPHESLPNSPISAAPSLSYSYRTKANGTDLIDIRQVATVTATSGATVVSSESYGYDSEGRGGSCTLTVNGRPPMRTDYSYDTLDRVKDLLYPAKNLADGSGRKTVHHDYDAAGRVSGLKVDDVDYASQLQYNAASQTTSLKVGAAGANQATESYDYDPTTGLISNQKVTRASGTSTLTLLDLSYDYLRAGTTSGRTGQLTKITNNLDVQKGRAYTYDALGRLTQATGGPSGAPLWTQTYSYDRWGNRTGVTASGFTARLEQTGGAQSRDQIAASYAPPLPDFLRGGDRRSVSDAPDAPPLFAGAANAATAGAALLDAPANLSVTQTSAATQSAPAQVTLSWSAPAGAVDHYRVERRDASGQYAFVANVSATSSTFADTTVSSGAAYLYRVRAVDASGGSSAYSNVALGTAYSFADDPIVTLAEDPTGATVTKIKAAHITQLREAVNAVRHLAGLADAAWTHSTLTPGVSPITADDVRDLRSALGAALSALGVQLPAYTDATIYNGQGGVWTIVKRDHVKELRQAATRGSGTASGGSGTPVPTDGLDGLAYNAASNRINTAGWEYDAAGSQTRARSSSGGWQRYEYDAANRLVRVLTDDRQTVIASYTYGSSNERLAAEEGGVRTYYAGGASGVAAEYTEAINSNQPQWSRSYVYLGARLLSVITPNGGGGEYVEYHHPDRLGTRLISNSANAYVQEQSGLPFGTVIGAETSAATGRRFTSYDRSTSTGLDYAVNRLYDPQQGRFTQVDPAGMKATRLETPQTLNLYAYCGNDPVNHTDPSGLGFFSFLKKLFKAVWRIAKVAAIVAALVVISYFAPLALPFFGKVVGWAAFILLIGTAVEAALLVVGHINQWLHRCRVPDFAGLSPRRQEELQQRGVSPDQWNGLPNKARLAYFNITAAIASFGLSLAGWLVDWAKGGIQQGRVFFKAGPGATNLVSQAVATGRFTHGHNLNIEHPGYPESYRGGFHPSLQLSFSSDGQNLDADLDSFNPSSILGAILHIGLEIIPHKLGSTIYGTKGTNPYNVAYRSSWECK